LNGEITLLRALFDAALQAADPLLAVPPMLPAKPHGRCVVVGAGKAAAKMAQAVDRAWPDVDLSGVVVTRHGHGAPAGRISVLEAGHPVPDAASQLAAQRILAAAQGLGPQDLVLALMSGGGSAVMALPAPGLTLAAKQGITRALLASGATIAEMNAVRRALSAIKGGRLAAAAAPARVVTIAISDVPGDDPATIASGPTVPAGPGLDPAAVLARYRIALPPGVQLSPPPALAPADVRLAATPGMALQAAAALARRHGVTPLILGDALEGEAREVGRVMAGMALSCRRHGVPAQPPCVLLSGGETTVTIGEAAGGRGGRNMEFLLSLACGLGAAPGIWALACDTDGIDGTEPAAGAWAGPDMLARAAASGVNVPSALAGHDSYGVFSALGQTIVTGPTLTNVNDFRVILIT
jgi:glycerate 2-kinase